MMTGKQLLWPLLVITVVVLAMLTLRPITSADAKDAVIISGELRLVKDSGNGDIGLRLVGDDNHYYINRGLYNGLQLEELQEVLPGKEVTIHYSDKFTLLDPKNTVRHVFKLIAEGEVIWDDLAVVDWK